LILGARVVEARRSSGGKILVLERKEQREMEIDEILVGVGRSPNVQDMGLEAAGVRYDDKKGVEVNDRLQTSNPRIYAAGDVCTEYKFTHIADAHARIVIRNALFFGRAKASRLTIPWCTYTDPEIAHVGLYEHEARRRGLDVVTFSVDMSDVDRALLDGEEEGMLKLHVKRGSDRILGATLVARHAGEMISEITALMEAGAGLRVLSRTIHPYPTQTEVFKRGADAYNRTRLTPRVRRVLAMFSVVRR